MEKLVVGESRMHKESFNNEIKFIPEEVERKIMDVIKAYFTNVISTSKELNDKEIEILYKNIFMTIFTYDINNSPSFSIIKEKKVQGLDEDGAKKFHDFKFKKIYEKYGKFVTPVGSELRTFKDEETLNIILGKISSDLNEILKGLSTLVRGFKLREFVQFHKIIIQAIMTPYLEDKDFELINKDNIDMLNNIENYFIKLFGKHYGFLECAKRE